MQENYISKMKCTARHMLTTLMLVSTLTTLWAQDTEHGRFGLYISADYGFMDPVELNELLEDRVERYQYDGIPMRLQESFNGGFGGSFKILYHFNPTISAGIVSSRSRFDAYALYEDAFGAIELHGKLVTTELTLGMEFRLFQIKRWTILGGASGGYRWFTMDFTDEVNTTEHIEYNTEYTVKNSAADFGARTFLGCEWRSGIYVAQLNLGYRYFKANEVDNKEVYHDRVLREGEIEWLHDLSAIFIELGVGIRI